MSSTAVPSSLPSVLSDPAPARRINPILAFIIGLAIILGASILNAAGLNLTKLDHVCRPALVVCPLVYACKGSDQLNAKGSEKERLDATIVASRHATLYVSSSSDIHVSVNLTLVAVYHS